VAVWQCAPGKGHVLTLECGDRLLDRAASVSHHEIVEAERVRYMERILSYYAPNLTFDIQSLRQAAEDLKSKHRESESDALSTKVDANELEDLAIDEEDFTIKALPNNTARKYPFSRLWLACLLLTPMAEYSGEFSYLNFSMKIRKKIDEWMKTAAPDVSLNLRNHNVQRNPLTGTGFI
jgi:hypothetical protein